MATKNKYARFYSLIRQLPELDKEEFVWMQSGLLTTHVSEFAEKNPKGYKEMMQRLEEMTGQSASTRVAATSAQPWTVSEYEAEAELKRLRSAILKRLQQYGKNTTDWNVVNAFLEQPQIAGKRLYSMTATEMRNLIPKLESILKKEEKKDEEELYKAQWN